MARIDTVTNFLTDVADSIRSKTGKSDLIACEDFDTEIASIQTGGGSVKEYTIDFYDYDGTILYQYSLNQIKKLSALPPAPTHEGLVSKGWNWSLEDLKEVGEPVDVGATYDTPDGSTKLYVSVSAFMVGKVTFVNLYKAVNTTVTYTVDWGDGSAIDTGTIPGSSVTHPSHTYTKAGDYVVTINSNMKHGITPGAAISIASNASYVGSRIFSKFAGTSLGSSTYLEDQPWWFSIRKIIIGSNMEVGSGLAALGRLDTVIIAPNEGGKIGASAMFYNVPVQNIIIPSGMVFRDNTSAPFGYTTAVKSISFPKDWQQTQIGFRFAIDNRCLKKLIFPDSVTSFAGNSALNGCYNLEYVRLPKNITSMGYYAFANCYSLKQIDIPDTVTVLYGSTFQNCYSLEEITLPDTMTTWTGTDTFNGCHTLKKVNIPEGVTVLGNNTFTNCYSLPTVTLPSTLTTMGTGMFQNCYALTEIIIPNSVTSIGASCFYYCYSLNNVQLPTNLSTIPNYCFAYCQNLKNITIPGNITSIGQYAFQECRKLKSIVVPTSVTSIGQYAFYRCQDLEELILNAQISAIPANCFSYIFSLNTIKIPSTVTSIAQYAFAYSYISVFDFSDLAQIPTLQNTTVFTKSYMSSDTKIIVPDELYEDWIVATNWSTYADYIVKASEV